jgi:hypothetical protein
MARSLYRRVIGTHTHTHTHTHTEFALQIPPHRDTMGEMGWVGARTARACKCANGGRSLALTRLAATSVRFDWSSCRMQHVDDPATLGVKV